MKKHFLLVKLAVIVAILFTSCEEDETTNCTELQELEITSLDTTPNNIEDAAYQFSVSTDLDVSYVWSINGEETESTGNSLSFEFPKNDTYEVCVTVSSNNEQCEDVQKCTTIKVDNLDEDVLTDENEEEDENEVDNENQNPNDEIADESNNDILDDENGNDNFNDDEGDDIVNEETDPNNSNGGNSTATGGQIGSSTTTCDSIGVSDDGFFILPNGKILIGLVDFTNGRARSSVFTWFLNNKQIEFGDPRLSSLPNRNVLELVNLEPGSYTLTAVVVNSPSCPVGARITQEFVIE